VSRFTRRWFRNRGAEANFQKHFLPLSGARLAYLEIGVFQGASLHWMLSNVLTHPESKALAVDPWEKAGRRTQANMDAVFNLACANLRSWISSGRLLLLRGHSELVLSAPGRPKFDIAYIDGHHGYEHVVFDWQLAWPSLKPGGTVVFDDHTPGRNRNEGVVRGVSEFIRCNPEARELFDTKYQIAFTKP